MKTTVTSLRLLVFTACFVVLLNEPPGWSPLAATTGASLQAAPLWYVECQSFGAATYYSCPTGCTNLGYYDYPDLGWGQQSAELNTDPCGKAQPGKSCSQPQALSAPLEDCLDCCVGEYGACAQQGGNLCCCSPYVCLTATGRCAECLPLNYSCGSNNDCCAGLVCPAGVCCKGSGYCEYNSDCCSLMCCDHMCMGASPAP